MKRENTYYLYQKMLIFYSAILLVIVIGLEWMFVINLTQQNRESAMYFQQRICKEESEEIQTMINNAQELLTKLYSTETQLADITNYLSYDIQTYIEKRLDFYSQSNYKVYDDKSHFMNEALESYDFIKKINLISYQNKNSTEYFKNKKVYIKKYFGKELTENEKILIKAGTLTIRKEIRDTLTRKILGEMQIYYSSEGIEKIYQNLKKGEIIVCSESGAIFYASDKEIRTTFDKTISSSKYQISSSNVNDLEIISYIDKEEAGQLESNTQVVLILSGFLLLCVGELFVHIYLKRFETRLEHILYAMERVKEGDLDVQVECQKKTDELDIIGANFNRMCQDLKRYIEKSYLALIAQKKAEMDAMQSQINPHFLYNTIEAIRMNTIANGDKVSAKMLYGMAVIFRSQIKENRIIPIAKELYYCKKYMELYEFRHPNKFHFDIDCPDELMSVPILKFIIQPIIENYFIHGIRLMERNNYVKIEVKKEDSQIMIDVLDNGKGMIETEIEILNKELQQGTGNKDSIGLRNIQMRIHAEFGDSYGIFLIDRKSGGLCVRLIIPKGELDYV